MPNHALLSRIDLSDESMDQAGLVDRKLDDGTGSPVLTRSFSGSQRYSQSQSPTTACENGTGSASSSPLYNNGRPQGDAHGRLSDLHGEEVSSLSTSEQELGVNGFDMPSRPGTQAQKLVGTLDFSLSRDPTSVAEGRLSNSNRYQDVASGVPSVFDGDGLSMSAGVAGVEDVFQGLRIGNGVVYNGNGMQYRGGQLDAETSASLSGLQNDAQRFSEVPMDALMHDQGQGQGRSQGGSMAASMYRGLSPLSAEFGLGESSLPPAGMKDRSRLGSSASVLMQGSGAGASSLSAGAAPFGMDHDGGSLGYRMEAAGRAQAQMNAPYNPNNNGYMVDMSHTSSQQQQQQQQQQNNFDAFVYKVQFKRVHRNYLRSSSMREPIRPGDFVIVEADRGEDLGVVCGVLPMPVFFREGGSLFGRDAGVKAGQSGDRRNGVKHIVRHADVEEYQLLSVKQYEEESVVQVCRECAIGRYLLPMEVVDAEYQFDRHKLTLYYESSRRIDFRELVRDMFAMYKTRIWMEHISYSFRPNEDAARALATGVHQEVKVSPPNSARQQAPNYGGFGHSNGHLAGQYGNAHGATHTRGHSASFPRMSRGAADTNYPPPYADRGGGGGGAPPRRGGEGYFAPPQAPSAASARYGSLPQGGQLGGGGGGGGGSSSTGNRMHAYGMRNSASGSNGMHTTARGFSGTDVTGAATYQRGFQQQGYPSSTMVASSSYDDVSMSMSAGGRPMQTQHTKMGMGMGMNMGTNMGMGMGMGMGNGQEFADFDDALGANTKPSPQATFAYDAGEVAGKHLYENGAGSFDVTNGRQTL